MRFNREINIHTDDVQGLIEYIKQRDISVHIAWKTTEVRGSGIAGRMNIPTPGDGTVSGDLPEDEVAALNAFISNLEATYWRPRK
jgi:hypothetical protein